MKEGKNPCIFQALEKVELMESSFAQTVSIPNQSANKNKPQGCWGGKLCGLPPENQDRDGAQKEGGEGKPLRIY